ncbi:oligosaccharide flippase family protein [Psychrobacter celer]|uniref:oligosaccharide flippase family protein n=1 Tax=Psychrobacter celer TaxID=306572 RepID=UPI003FD4F1CE
MRAVILLLIGVLVGSGANFLVQLYLAKELSVADFGIYTSIINLVNLLTPLIAFGISNFMLRAYAEEANDAKRWVNSIITVLVVSSLLTFCILQSWSYYKNGIEYLFLYCLFFIYMLSLSLNAFTRLKFQVEENFTALSIWQLIPNMSKLLVLVLIIFFAGATVFNVAIAYSISGAIVLAMSANTIARMKKGDFKLEPIEIGSINYQKNSILNLLKNSYPYGLSGMFYLIYYQSDILILTYYLDYESVGYYGFSLVFVTAICLLPSIYYQSFKMKYIHFISRTDKSLLKDFYRSHFYYSLFVGFLFFIIFISVIKFFIVYVFGDKYIPALNILYALSVYIPIKFITLNSDAIMNTKDLVDIKVKIMGLAAAVNIFLNLILIPFFSAMGAVFSTIITELFLLLSFYFVLKRRL